MAITALRLACGHVVPPYPVDHPHLLRGCPLYAVRQTVIGAGSAPATQEAPTGPGDLHEHHRSVLVIDADNQTTLRRIPMR